MKTFGMSPSIGNWSFKTRNLAIIVALLLVLVIGLYLSVMKSDAYDEAVHFARTNVEVTKRIGNVSEVHVRFLDGFNITHAGSGGDASLVLGLEGDHGESILDVRLKRIASAWRVEEAYISTNSEKGVPISVAAINDK